MKPPFILSTLFLPTLAAAALVGGQEQIDNGSFSAGLTGWSTQGNVSIDAGALRLSAGGTAWQVYDAPGYPTGAFEFGYEFKTSAPYDSWRLSLSGEARFKTVHGETYGGVPSFWSMYDARPVAIDSDTWYRVSVIGDSHYSDPTLTLTRISDGLVLSNYVSTLSSPSSPSGGRIQIHDFLDRPNGDFWITNISLYQVPETSVSTGFLVGLFLLTLTRPRRNRIDKSV